MVSISKKFVRLTCDYFYDGLLQITEQQNAQTFKDFVLVRQVFVPPTSHPPSPAVSPQTKTADFVPDYAVAQLVDSASQALLANDTPLTEIFKNATSKQVDLLSQINKTGSESRAMGRREVTIQAILKFSGMIEAVVFVHNKETAGKGLEVCILFFGFNDSV